MTDCFIIVYHSDINSPSSSELPCYPDEISENQSAVWSDVQIMGRSSPLTAYTGTGFRSVSMSFDLHREMENGNNSIENVLRIIRKSVYPEYQEKGLIPPTTIIGFGKFMVRGVVRSYSYTWKKPIIDNDYQVCSVSIQIDDIPTSVFGAANIKATPTNPFGVTDPRSKR